MASKQQGSRKNEKTGATSLLVLECRTLLPDIMSQASSEALGCSYQNEYLILKSTCKN
jgi:hypothetical protein